MANYPLGDYQKLITSDGLIVDNSAMTWLQDARNRAQGLGFHAVMNTPGIVINDLTEWPDPSDFRVVQGTAADEIKVNAGPASDGCIAFDKDVQLIAMEADSANVTVPVAVRKVVIEYQYVDDTIGSFLPGYPTGGDPAETHRNDSYLVSLITGAPTAYQIYLADVEWDGATMTITDRRTEWFTVKPTEYELVAFSTLPDGLSITQLSIHELHANSGTADMRPVAESETVAVKFDLSTDAVHPNDAVDHYEYKVVRMETTVLQDEKFVFHSESDDPKCTGVVPKNVKYRVYYRAVTTKYQKTEWLTESPTSNAEFVAGAETNSNAVVLTIVARAGGALISWTHLADHHLQTVWTTHPTGEPAEPDFDNLKRFAEIQEGQTEYFIEAEPGHNIKVKGRRVDEKGNYGPESEPASTGDYSNGYATAKEGVTVENERKLRAVAPITEAEADGYNIQFPILGQIADAGITHPGKTGLPAFARIQYKDRRVEFTLPSGAGPIITKIDELAFNWETISLRAVHISVFAPPGNVLDPAQDELRVYSVLTGDDADVIVVPLNDTSAEPDGIYTAYANRAYDDREKIDPNTPVIIDCNIASTLPSPTPLEVIVDIAYNYE